MLHPITAALAEKNMTGHRIAAQATARTGPARQPADLPAAAARIAARLRQYFTPAALPVQQVLAVAEEAGEFTAAYRRWAGMARRTGTWDDVEAELADVVITAYVTAAVLGIDLDAACRAKTAVIFTRGWREPPPAG
jgi:NTP pyrophosphatase (non-canonical NTP hydrolase)